MRNKLLGIGVVLLAGLLVIGAVALLALPETAQAAGGSRWGVDPGRTDGGPVRPAPVEDLTPGDLSDAEVEALQMALDDEYKAWSVYEQVIADFGAVRPFTSIQRAEEKHIAALVTLFDRYGLDVPVNPWPGTLASYETLGEACEAGVQAEIDNAALYADLFDMVDNPDIIRVFTALQRASQTKHLPAFERCAP